MLDARMMLAIAEAVTDDAEKVFLDRIGTAERIRKGRGDFATSADLDIERMLRNNLTAITGIPVYGEEGGGVFEHDAMWVVDPIDGTSNYAVGNPMCSILISLMVEGRPVAAVCSMPAFGKRLTAYEGSALVLNGSPVVKKKEFDPELNHIGFGPIVAADGHEFHSTFRRALHTELSLEHVRLRASGSVGIDLAFAALGIYSAAVTFSPFTWDNAAGVLLCQAAGLTVTDLHGNPWTKDATGVVAGITDQHTMIMEKIREIRDQ